MKTLLIENRKWNGEGIKLCNYGDENSHFKWVLDNTSHSFDSALNDQGYEILKPELVAELLDQFIK